MFVNIIHFPPIKNGKDAAFKEWFTWSTELYGKHKGFVSRKLLQPRDGGHYVAVVEHESFDTFMTMHTSPTQAEVNAAAEGLFDNHPTPEFYDVILE